MTLLTPEFAERLAGAAPPCLSLYQPTHRHHPDNRQDPIRFRNLVRELEQSVRNQSPATDVGALLAPFERLAANTEFWAHRLDGLAVFAAPGLFEYFETQRPVTEFVIVADSFHTKPLRRLLQSSDRYQLLGLSRSRVRLFEGDRDVLDEVPLAPGVPHTIADALGEELSEPNRTVAVHGGGSPGSAAITHGHGEKSDLLDADTERFFRAVDRAILDHHSRPSGLPLILAALPEHHASFRQVSKNPQLAPEGIPINYEAVSRDELRQRAWQLFEPVYRARLASLGDAFAEARVKGMGADDLAAVAAAASAGRVGTLLIESERRIPGRFDPSTGEIQLADGKAGGVDDLLDDLGEAIAQKGGEVLVVPAEFMPVKTGIAATFRY